MHATNCIWIQHRGVVYVNYPTYDSNERGFNELKSCLEEKPMSTINSVRHRVPQHSQPTLIVATVYWQVLPLPVDL